MSIHHSLPRSFLGISFGASLALSGACRHPCEADPNLCPQLTLEVSATPTADHPGLIQRKATGAALSIKVSGQNGETLEGLGELSAYFCAVDSECKPDCRGLVKLPPLSEPKTTAEPSSRTYQIQSAALADVPLGPTKLCVSGRVVASKEMYVINKLLSRSGMNEQSPPVMSGYSPVSFDLARDKVGILRAIILGQKDSTRTIDTYAFPGFAGGYAISGIGTAEKVQSLRSVSVGSDAFLLWGASSTSPPYRVSLCPLEQKNATCDTTQDGTWKVSDTAGVDTTVGDTLGKRFIVSLQSGPKSLKAFSTELNQMQPLKKLWEADGPAEPVALAAAPLQPLSARSLSDVIAVGKNAAGSGDRDAKVFLATSGGTVELSDAYSKGLQSAIREALGMQPLTALASGDLDGDKLADVVLLSSAPDKSQISILFNMGNGSFRVAGKSLGSSMPMKDLEASLGSLTVLSDSVDVKIENVDVLDPKDLSKERPEILILNKVSGGSASQIQVLRLE